MFRAKMKIRDEDTSRHCRFLFLLAHDPISIDIPSVVQDADASAHGLEGGSVYPVQ